jgi:hypothetical protein
MQNKCEINECETDDIMARIGPLNGISPDYMRFIIDTTKTEIYKSLNSDEFKNELEVIRKNNLEIIRKNMG